MDALGPEHGVAGGSVGLSANFLLVRVFAGLEEGYKCITTNVLKALCPYLAVVVEEVSVIWTTGPDSVVEHLLKRRTGELSMSVKDSLISDQRWEKGKEYMITELSPSALNKVSKCCLLLAYVWL